MLWCLWVTQGLFLSFFRPVGVFCLSTPLWIPVLGPDIAHIPQPWIHYYFWVFIICIFPPSEFSRFPESAQKKGGNALGSKLLLLSVIFTAEVPLLTQKSLVILPFPLNHHPFTQSFPTEGNYREKSTRRGWKRRILISHEVQPLCGHFGDKEVLDSHGPFPFHHHTELSKIIQLPNLLLFLLSHYAAKLAGDGGFPDKESGEEKEKKRKIPWNCFLSKGEFECDINKQPNTSCCLHGIRGRLQGWVLRETPAVIMSRLPLHEVQSCRRKGGNEECSEKGVVQWEIAVIPFFTGLCKCADGRFYLAAWIQFSRLLEVWCLHRVKEEVL